MNLKTALGRFRLIAFVEGCSFLILLFIAMPLKYLADQPLPVKYTGWMHGVLFVLFGFALIQVWIARRWKFSRVMIAFISSLLPFGTFIFDRSLKQEQEQERLPIRI